MSTGAELIAAERQRQISVEGWTPEHDQGHERELEAAAISYAVWGDVEQPPEMWPWAASWWKPKDRLRNLVRAGALFQAAGEAVELTPAMRYCGQRDLIVAEIDRFAASPPAQPADPPTCNGSWLTCLVHGPKEQR